VKRQKLGRATVGTKFNSLRNSKNKRWLVEKNYLLDPNNRITPSSYQSS